MILICLSMYELQRRMRASGVNSCPSVRLAASRKV
jgi:hypothetical protein